MSFTNVCHPHVSTGASTARHTDHGIGTTHQKFADDDGKALAAEEMEAHGLRTTCTHTRTHTVKWQWTLVSVHVSTQTNLNTPQHRMIKSADL